MTAIYNHLRDELSRCNASTYSIFNVIISNKTPENLNLTELQRMTDKIESVALKIHEKSQEQVNKIPEKSSICKKISQVSLSLTDTGFALAGGVLLFIGLPWTQAAGSVMIVVSQAFSKSSDLNALCTRNRKTQREKFASLEYAADVVLDMTKNISRLIKKLQSERIIKRETLAERPAIISLGSLTDSVRTTKEFPEENEFIFEEATFPEPSSSSYWDQTKDFIRWLVI